MPTIYTLLIVYDIKIRSNCPSVIDSIRNSYDLPFYPQSSIFYVYYKIKSRKKIGAYILLRNATKSSIYRISNITKYGVIRRSIYTGNELAIRNIGTPYQHNERLTIMLEEEIYTYNTLT